MLANAHRDGLRSLLKSFTALTLVVSVAACSTPGGMIQPQLGTIKYDLAPIPEDLMADWPAGLQASMNTAFAHAAALDDALVGAMGKNDVYSFITGAAMYAAGIVTLAFGVFDASRTLLLAGGLTTASLAGVRQFYPFAARNELYSKGRTALQCAVQATRVGVSLGAGDLPDANDASRGTGVGRASPEGDGASLAQLLENAETAALRLRGEAAAVEALPTAQDISLELRRLLFVPAAEQSASDLLGAVSAGRVVQDQLQPGLQVALLQNAITKIQAIVDAEADKLQPNPEAALDAARGQLTANLTAVKESALKARNLAAEVDNNKMKTPPATEKDVKNGQKDGGAGDGAGQSQTGKDPADAAVKAANRLEARMQTVNDKLSNIDACIKALDGSGA